MVLILTTILITIIGITNSTATIAGTIAGTTTGMIDVTNGSAKEIVDAEKIIIAGKEDATIVINKTPATEIAV